MSETPFEEQRKKTEKQRYDTTYRDQTTQKSEGYDPRVMDAFSARRPRELTAAKQSGANCGCFAAGMAIEALIRDCAKEDYEERVGNRWPDVMAAEIEAIAREKNLSAVGEMFSADMLAEAVRSFSTMINTSTVELKPGELAPGIKVHAETASFDNVESLKKIITQATQKGIKVLIPYYAGEALMPARTHGNVSPQNMDSAHWAIISEVLDQSAYVTLFEGNQIINGVRIRLTELVKSNECLGDYFDWTAFLDKNRAQEKKARKRIEQYDDALDRFINSFEEPMKNVLMEFVNAEKELLLELVKIEGIEKMWEHYTRLIPQDAEPQRKKKKDEYPQEINRIIQNMTGTIEKYIEKSSSVSSQIGEECLEELIKHIAKMVIDISQAETAKKTVTEVEDRVQIRELVTEEEGRNVFKRSGDHLLEEVSLRGKIVLIGQKRQE